MKNILKEDLELFLNVVSLKEFSNFKKLYSKLNIFFSFINKLLLFTFPISFGVSITSYTEQLKNSNNNQTIPYLPAVKPIEPLQVIYGTFVDNIYLYGWWLFALGVIGTYLWLKTYSKTKKILKIPYYESTIKNLRESLNEMHLNRDEIINAILIDIYKTVGFNSNERVNAYFLKDNSSRELVNTNRYSTNLTFNEMRCNKVYDGNKGILKKCLDNHNYNYQLKGGQSQTRENWEKKQALEFGFSFGEIKELKMESHSYYGYSLMDDKTHTVKGLILFESTIHSVIDEDKAKDLFTQLENRKVALLSSISKLQLIEMEDKVNLADPEGALDL